MSTEGYIDIERTIAPFNNDGTMDRLVENRRFGRTDEVLYTDERIASIVKDLRAKNFFADTNTQAMSSKRLRDVIKYDSNFIAKNLDTQLKLSVSSPDEEDIDDIADAKNDINELFQKILLGLRDLNIRKPLVTLVPIKGDADGRTTYDEIIKAFEGLKEQLEKLPNFYTDEVLAEIGIPAGHGFAAREAIRQLVDKEINAEGGINEKIKMMAQIKEVIEQGQANNPHAQKTKGPKVDKPNRELQRLYSQIEFDGIAVRALAPLVQQHLFDQAKEEEAKAAESSGEQTTTSTEESAPEMNPGDPEVEKNLEEAAIHLYELVELYEAEIESIRKEASSGDPELDLDAMNAVLQNYVYQVRKLQGEIDSIESRRDANSTDDSEGEDAPTVKRESMQEAAANILRNKERMNFRSTRSTSNTGAAAGAGGSTTTHTTNTGGSTTQSTNTGGRTASTSNAGSTTSIPDRATLLAMLRAFMRNAAYWAGSFAQHPRKSMLHKICTNGKQFGEGFIDDEIKRLEKSGRLDAALLSMVTP